MRSLTFVAHVPRATERRLEMIYEAAKAGLKGDAIAIAAGLDPKEYKRLKEFDDNVRIAELQGKTDSELEHARMLAKASREGDAKASLAILRHQHGWADRTDINVSVTHINIAQALQEAQGRVIEVQPE